MTENKPITLYFLCTGNAHRSQMAEGLAKDIFKDQAKVYSAGLVASGLPQRTIDAMAEVGIDISQQTSDIIDDKLLNTADYVITLCDHAKDHCPVIPSHAKHLHWGLFDPADATGSDEDIMAVYRKVREEAKEKIVAFKTKLGL